MINDDPRDLELARLLGEVVKIREPVQGFDTRYNPVVMGHRDLEHAPNYCADLDRVQRAAAKLSQTNHWRYTGHLLMQVGAENESGIHNFAALLKASPVQHVAALILTLKEKP